MSKTVVPPKFSIDDQDDRVRAALGLTSDDPLPVADYDSLLAYREHLVETLSFPFEATYAHETGPFRETTRRITVIALGEADNSWIDDMYGLICRAREGRRRVDVPLCDLHVTNRGPNQQLVADYSYWFSNHH